MNKYSNIIIITLLYLSLISASPLLTYYGLNAILILIPVLIVFVIYALVIGRTLHINVIRIIIFIVFLSLIVAFYHEDIYIFLIPVFFIINLLFIGIIKKTELLLFVNLATYFLLVIMLLGVVGIIYDFLGGEPVMSITNPDGRINNLFLTTFSNTNTEWVPFIRPSGIFDEPGALSFFICLLATVRHVLKLNNKLTWAILILGILTFSLAHLVFFIFYLLSQRGLNFKKIIFTTVLLSAFSVIVSTTPLNNMFKILVLNRIEISEDGTLRGDNRSDRMINAISLLDFKNTFFGLDNKCIINPQECAKYGSIDSNPVYPLVRQGILLTFPYYAILIILLYGLVKYKDPIYIGLLLLFLQRPSVMVIGYSFWAVLIVILILNNKKYLNESS